MPIDQIDDGVRITSRTRREGPLTLLFMHGWGGSGAYFEETLKPLNMTGLRAIATDLRGHGDSDKPETSSLFPSSFLSILRRPLW